MPGVFGKWSRPNYNTVVATFCHNIARGQEIAVSDPNRELELVYIDDVIAEFLRHLDVPPPPGQQRYAVSRTFRVTLGELAERIQRLHAIRGTLLVPDLRDELNRCLHATFLSFLPEDDFDIPPGYTHSIENTGDREMICLFWANQVFDPGNPDTYFSEIRK